MAGMTLQQTIEVLGNLNIQTALDVGVHANCDLQSNCPIAVQLRKVVGEAHITGEQLLTGLAAITVSPPEAIHFELPKVEAIADLNIAGIPVRLDLAPVINPQLTRFYQGYITQLQNGSRQLATMGRGLYSSYALAIQESRKLKELPQLIFTIPDIIKANCMVTSGGSNYFFLFPRLYSPQYIVTRGVRYKIADTDIIHLIHKINVQLTISRDNRFVDMRILNEHGEKFVHYHGRAGGDCWGQVTRPPIWDKRLRSLENLIIQLMGSLSTINKDSMLEREPPGMPHIDVLFGRSTRQGEEGLMEDRVQPEGTWTDDRGTHPLVARPAWGRGR